MKKTMNQVEIDFWNFLIPINKKESLKAKRKKVDQVKPFDQTFMLLSCSSIGLIIGVLASILIQII